MDFKAEPETEWSKLSPEQKKHQLFEKQKQMLDEFLAHGAIDKTQYDISLNGLIEKMGIKPSSDS